MILATSVPGIQPLGLDVSVVPTALLDMGMNSGHPCFHLQRAWFGGLVIRYGCCRTTVAVLIVKTFSGVDIGTGKSFY